MSPKRQLRYLFDLFRRIVKARTPKAARLLELLALAQMAETLESRQPGPVPEAIVGWCG